MKRILLLILCFFIGNTVKAETITLECKYSMREATITTFDEPLKELYIPDGIDYFTVNTDNNQVYYVNGVKHDLFNSVEISKDNIKLNISKNDGKVTISGLFIIDRYTGLYSGTYQIESLAKAFPKRPIPVFTVKRAISGTCSPYKPIKKF